MWTIGFIILAIIGAGSAAGGHLWGLWLLILGGLCGAEAERNMADQELAFALFFWLMAGLLLFSGVMYAWGILRSWLA